jgi:hypothetical protein
MTTNLIIQKGGAMSGKIMMDQVQSQDAIEDEDTEENSQDEEMIPTSEEK